MTTPPPLLASQELIDDLRAYRSAGTRGARLTICTRAAAALEAISADLCAKIAQNSELAAENGSLIALLTECAAEIRVMSEWASGPTAEQYAALHSRVTATLERTPQP